MRLNTLFTGLLAIAVAGPALAEDLNIGLKGKQYKARLVVGGLSNPSSVSFSPKGKLTVCDSANGQVVLVKDGAAEKYITGFATEYWKVDAEKGTKKFKLGPLSSVWIDDSTLAVTNAGLGDGAENVLIFNGPGTAADGVATNAVGPTSDDAKDKGEGNLTGLSISEDGSTIYVCGQGADAKSWLLAVDVATKKMTSFASADEASIEVNSPMATLPWNNNTVLALYSGAGGKDDGLIVQWSNKGRVLKKWTLPGLTDPMGFARIPDSRSVVVVDNNWSLTEVKAGRLARVSIPRDAKEARVAVISEGLRGPVSCAFGPDGDLYIAQLGTQFDSDKGQIIAVSGIKKWVRKEKPAAN